MQSTIQMGDEYTVSIDDVAFGGDGVGRIQGMAVFVPFTMAGESVRIRVTRVHRTFARGECVEVRVPSTDRTPPPCPWFGRCAGCQYQHLAYDAQLQVKTRQLRDLFKRIGHVDNVPLAPIVPAPNPWAYRTRVTLHGPGQPAFVGIDHQDRVAVDACAIARPELNHALQTWKAEHPDGLKEAGHLSIRADADGRTWIATKKDRRVVKQQLKDRLFEVPLQSFFQVNPDVANALAAFVVDRVREAACRTLIDAYCGVGVFALLAAAHAEKVYGMEADQQAIRVARRNARRMKCQNAVMVAGRTETLLPEILRREHGPSTLCLLDPPRKGCAPSVLKALTDQGVARILYISCAPDCLARDAATLIAAGYGLDQVTPFDMFPQTAHIEVVAEFSRSVGS